MGRLLIPGVCQKNGITYRRFKEKRDGKWKDVYVHLPDPSDPRFAEALARVNRKGPAREKAASGTIRALIIEKRKQLAKVEMADTTRSAWAYYLGLIEQQHGKRLVSDLRRAHCYRIRDGMADTPGKANNYMAKFKALLEFACERDWIPINPAKDIPQLDGGEHEPWPVALLEAALEKASPMLRLAIISGLCSGQRVSDVIRMQHGWHDGHFMELRSKKTDTPAVIPMHPFWLAAIEAMPRSAVTLLYDRSGKPFTGPDRIQERIRRLMTDLGEVDEEGRARFTFHGLGKNAICYLTELGLSEDTISAITGKTPETVRYYAKNARRWMLARQAAPKVLRGRFGGLVGNIAGNGGKRSTRKR